MVKFIFVAFTVIVLYACGNKDESFSNEMPFDRERYDLENYSGRVKKFLDSRSEIGNLKDYRAVFLNTEGCSSCAKGSFSEIYTFMEKTTTDLFIYSNDSSLSEMIPANPKIRFVCLTAKEFRSHDIFHNKIYLYTVNDGNLIATPLQTQEADSLNALYD